MRLSPSLLLIIFALASAADLQLRGLPGTDVEQLTDPTTAVPSTARTEPGLREYKFGEYKPSDAPKVACIKFESINMVGDTVFVGSDGSGPPTVGDMSIGDLFKPESDIPDQGMISDIKFEFKSICIITPNSRAPTCSYEFDMEFAISGFVDKRKGGFIGYGSGPDSIQITGGRDDFIGAYGEIKTATDLSKVNRLDNGNIEGFFVEMGINLCYPLPRKAVLVLMDSSLVDSLGEGLNTVIDAEGAVGEVDTITTYITGSIASGLLDGVTRFVIPELEKSSFLDVLSHADQTALRSYVESGAGRLIVMGSGKNGNGSGDNGSGSNTAALINGIFDFEVEVNDCTGDKSKKTGEAADTIFKDNAANVNSPSKIRCLKNNSLPPAAVRVYKDGSRSSVTTFYNDNLVHIAYDWNGGSGTGWSDILATALRASTTSGV